MYQKQRNHMKYVADLHIFHAFFFFGAARIRRGSAGICTYIFVQCHPGSAGALQGS